MSLELHFLQSHLDISPGNMGAIWIYPQWNKDRAANGIQICWLITAGHLYGRPQRKNTRHERRGNNFLILYLLIFRLDIVRWHNFHNANSILQFWKYINGFLNYNQQDATIFDYLFLKALYVSGGSSAHHQEYTASGIVNQYCCRLVSWMRWNTEVPFHPQYQPAVCSSIDWQ